MPHVPQQFSYVASVHWIAVSLAWVVFPLIWVGGLVTSYDAGMAVPDWPNTYGYNLFLYPPESWIYGPFDLFVEHGHRLLASIAGMLSIVLVIVAQRQHVENWVKWWSWLLLGLVIGQGLLGGLRVVFDARSIALIHGCVGPAYFSSVIVMCVGTSKWWFTIVSKLAQKRIAQFNCLAWITLFTCFLQLILGACMRHISDNATPDRYRVLVLMHLAIAGMVLLLAAGQLVVAILRRGALVSLLRSISILFGLVVTQILFGLSTWVVKFGYPSWFRNTETGEFFVVQEKSLFQMNIITAHVAIGALIIAVATYVAVRSSRVYQIQLQYQES